MTSRAASATIASVEAGMRAARGSLIAALLVLAAGPAVGIGDWQEKRVMVDGISIRCLDTGLPGGEAPGGEAPGPTILFVHGYCGAAANFSPLLACLSAGVGGVSGSLRCIAVDLPGCAGSDKPEIPYSTAGFVDFLDSFRRSLGLGRIVLVGHSMGGQICVHFTERFPQAVQKLILIAPDGLAGEEGGWLAVTGLGPLVEAGLMLANRSFVEVALRTVVFSDQALVSPALVDCFAEGLLTPEGVRATAEITRRVIGHDPVDGILPRIRQPTLVIWGAEDRLLKPSWGYRFVALLPEAELFVLSECGHAPMLEKPAETAGLIAAFLSR
jgi:abhydrolase domain-containing protein 6